MVSAEKLKSLLNKPDRFAFQLLNYGETIGVKLKSGERQAWLCGVAALGLWDEDGNFIGPDPLPYVSEEELASCLNSLP